MLIEMKLDGIIYLMAVTSPGINTMLNLVSLSNATMLKRPLGCVTQKKPQVSSFIMNFGLELGLLEKTVEVLSGEVLMSICDGLETGPGITHHLTA